MTDINVHSLFVSIPAICLFRHENPSALDVFLRPCLFGANTFYIARELIRL